MRWLIAALLIIATSSAVAADGTSTRPFGRDASSALYGELHLGAGGVRHSDLDFFPLMGSVTAGVYVLPHIGVEVFADTALAEGDKAGFELSVSQAFGIAARFESPPSGGTQGYVVIGAVNFEVDQERKADGSAPRSVLSEDFTGGRFSVGVMQRLERFPDLQVSFEYRHYAVDEPIKVDGLVLGLRFNAR